MKEAVWASTVWIMNVIFRIVRVHFLYVAIDMLMWDTIPVSYV